MLPTYLPLLKRFILQLTGPTLVLSAVAQAPVHGPGAAYPTPNPPTITREAPATPVPAKDGPVFGPPILWSIGQPTDEEQLYLEYINRSRANPTAEAFRLASTTDQDVLEAYSSWSVDLQQMIRQFTNIPPVAPLAMNEQLLIAARLHSGDMFTNEFQGHVSTSGATLTNRLAAQGYAYSTAGENVFSYAESVWHGHAGFNVDWGNGPYGMQSPPGHRNSIHNSGYREIGVGVVLGVNGSVGPQLVTQDFGSRLNATPMLCGVAYYDLNGNGFYDLGEGIGGINVEALGADYSAITADSGGYAIPVTANANYTINFNTSGISTQQLAAVAAANVKVDWVPRYTPPGISGPSPAGINLSNFYTFNAVGGATAYDWEQSQLTPFAADGAENGLARATATTTPGYEVITTDRKASGTYSFHLAQPEPAAQYVQWNATIKLGGASTLSFSKLLGWATSSQVGRAQVSTNDGGSWVTIWSQAGNNGAGESTFSVVNVPLSAYANQNIRLRFVYDFIGGLYFGQTDAGVGLYLDNIAISNANELTGTIVAAASPTRSFVFTPTQAGDYVLRVRARINSRFLPWGPATQVAAAAIQLPPQVQFVSTPVVNGNQVQVEFTVANYRAGMTFQLLQSTTAAGAYSPDPSAAIQTVIANTRFRATTTTGGASNKFYRVQGTY